MEKNTLKVLYNSDIIYCLDKAERDLCLQCILRDNSKFKLQYNCLIVLENNRSYNYELKLNFIKNKYYLRNLTIQCLL